MMQTTCACCGKSETLENLIGTCQTCREVRTPKPLHRGVWVKCSDENPPRQGWYQINDAGMTACFSGERWIIPPDEPITHWLKLHPLPPLPEQEKKDAFDEFWFMEQGKQHTFKTLAQAAWNAGRASSEKGKG
jgi:hypothetical protein